MSTYLVALNSFCAVMCMHGGGAGYECVSKKMKTVLVLLLLALLGLSEAEYRRTVSYEGEVVVKWYVSSDIVTAACRRAQL